MTTLLCAFTLASSLAGLTQPPVQAEVIGEVRVHGNHTTPDADVLALAGLTVGSALGPESLTEAEKRLRDSGRFADVEVRKRFRSIADPTDILIVVMVDEHAAVSRDDLTPGPLKRVTRAGMWLPVLDYADGYGFTYGARFSFVDLMGARSRLSVPLTWGGERRVALQAERVFERGPLTRIEGSLSLSRRVNPHFETSDIRREVTLRGERAFTWWLKAGGGVKLTNVDFRGIDQRHTTPAFDITIDTRQDPTFPRNAIHTTIGWERLNFASAEDVTRRSTDMRGYIGLFRSTVLALRATASQVKTPLPEYEQALLGGTSQLRGYRFGYRAGDNLAAASAELRVPLTSPLNVGRLGVKVFVDAGTVYPVGQSLSDQTWDRGIGGGVFLTATVLRMGLDVAWPSTGNKPRWHFGMGVSF